MLTSEALTAEGLRATIGEGIDDAEVLVVAPALHDSPLRFWLSDADGAIERADGVWRNSVRRLSNEGIAATGDTGEGDPLAAIEDALRTFDADRIVIFRHGEDDLAYREDELVDLQGRFGRPLQTRVIGAP